MHSIEIILFWILLFSWASVICSVIFSPHAWQLQGAVAAAAAKSLQSCPTLCDPIDGSPSGSPVLGILQARTLEWVAISFSSAWKWKVKVKSFSHAQLLATPWTKAYQTLPSMGFSRQEYWSGMPLPSLKGQWQGAIDLSLTNMKPSDQYTDNHSAPR